MKIFHNRLRTTLTLMTVIPVLVLGIVFAFFGVETIRNCIETEAKSSLEGVCLRLRDEFVEKNPGDYKIADGRYFSGDTDISESSKLLDTYKEQFHTEVTIFFDEERALTTITDNNGEKIIGTAQSDTRVLEALKRGENFTASDVDINGEQYYVCYIPLLDKGETVGMVFAGISDKNVDASIKNFSRRFIGLTAGLVFLIAIIVIGYSTQIASRLTSIRKYLGTLVEVSNDEAQMDDKTLGRSDEIGELARYAVKVGGQLTNIMGKDPLTGLFNRRAGRHLLDGLQDDFGDNQTEYTLVMCDVDHFKNVNDTYGHEVGDVVLKEFAKIVLETCEAYPGSFAIRWGGEEILLGFKLSVIYSLEAVETIKKRMDDKVFTFADTPFKVSATFGMAGCKEGTEIHDIIVAADEKLYRGKANGRNRIEI